MKSVFYKQNSREHQIDTRNKNNTENKSMLSLSDVIAVLPPNFSLRERVHKLNILG